MKTKLRKALDAEGRKLNYLRKSGLEDHRIYYVTATGRARPAEKRAISSLLRCPQRELF